jgi:hypothetical protein
MVWLTVLGILVVIGYYVVLRRRSQRQPLTSEERPASTMNTVTLAHARSVVAQAIESGELIGDEPGQDEGANLEQLGPITREFFSRYLGIRSLLGGFRVGVSEIRTSTYISGYVSIGHSEDWDIVQRPGNDEVFIVEGSEANESEMQVRFPSVYHFILDELNSARSDTKKRATPKNP